MINTGLDLIAKFMRLYKINIENDFELAKESVANAQIDSQTVSGDTRSAVDNIVEGIMVMQQSNLIAEDKILINESQGFLCIHTPTVYPLFKKWARETSFEGEVISHSEFVRQLCKMDYYDDYKTVRMGSDNGTMSQTTRKSRILKISVLKDKEIIDL